MKLILFLKSKTFWLNVVLALALYAILALSTPWILKGITSFSQVAVVPDLSGLTWEEALVKLEEHHLKGVLLDSSKYDPNVKPYGILEQYPIAGSKAKYHRNIALNVNKRREIKIALPGMVDRTLQRAQMDLVSRGLVMGKITYVQDSVGEGLVRKVSAGGKLLAMGDKVRKGTTIDLVVGKRSMDPTHPVPNIRGMRFGEAKAILRLSELRIVLAEGDSTNTSSVILRQDPENSMGSPILFKNGAVRVWLGNALSLEDNGDE